MAFVMHMNSQHSERQESDESNDLKTGPRADEQNSPSGLRRGLWARKKEVCSFWIFFALSIAVGVAVSYGVLGPQYLTPNFDKNLPAGYDSGVYLLGVVNTLDLGNAVLGIQWLLYSCEENGPYSGCNALNNATNFFVDQYAAPATGLDPATAALQYKANLTGDVTDGFCLNDASCWDDQLKKGIPYEQTLQTSHAFSIRNSAYNWRANSQAYPFDVYSVFTTFLAIDPANNSSRKILGVSLTGTIPNYEIQMTSRAVDNPQFPNLEWRMVSMKVSRAQIVIGYAFLIWVINWCMTGVVMWITISAVQGRRKIPADLFGIPITALFALPTVRGIMPGAPFFGCILDYSGIILNLLVLVICSVSLLLSVIARESKGFYTPEPRPIHLPSEPRPTFLGFLHRRSTKTGAGSEGLGLSELQSEKV